MNDMRVGLVALGALFIVAVWAFNKFQERRVRRNVENAYARTHPDVLLDREAAAARASGHFSTDAAPDDAPWDGRGDGDGGSDPAGRAEPSMRFDTAAPGGRIEPVLDRAGTPVPAAAIPTVTLDEDIHALITLSVEQPVSGERIMACLQAFRHAGRQSVSVLGAREYGWHAIQAGERYDTVVVAVQLANRSGPLNEIEYSEFVTALQHAAEQIPASCDVPDMMETIARARSLDARCAPLDAQIGINLANPEGTWSGDLIAGLAREAGLLLRADGRFHFVLDDGLSLFALQNGDGAAFRADTLHSTATDRVTLLLDVPRAPQALQPYARMTTMAQSLSAKLGAVLVDDQLHTLTPTMLATIERQIEPVYASLEAEGMSAGSGRALALFR